MRVIWASSAEQDRTDIVDYIAQDNPLAAADMDDLFCAAAKRLEDHPLMGRPGQVVGTREVIPHESYRLVYEVTGDTLRILALVHTARRWPPTQR